MRAAHLLLSLIAALLLAGLLTACHRNVEARTASSAPAAAAESPARFPLPSGWPLAEIAPPEGASPAARPYSSMPGFGDEFATTGSPFNQGSENAGVMWSVGFSYRGGLQSALKHFAARAAELNWQLYFDQPTTREYISPDSRYIAQLHYDGENNVFVLSIFVYDKLLQGAETKGA